MARFSFYFGAAASALSLAILVIAAELAEPFKTILKTIFTHHWIGKLVIVTLAFVVVGYLMREKTSLGHLSDEKLAWYGVLGGLIVIFLFFVAEYFKMV